MKYARLGLWAIAAVAALVGATMWRREDALTIELTLPPSLSPNALAAPSVDSLDAAADFIVGNNLFRVTRSPADSSQLAAAAKPIMQPQRSPKPKLVLRGVIGGPPWDAIVEGIPGVLGGRVVRDGEALHGFSVRIVHRDMVIVRGADTVWTLTLGHP